MPVGIVKRRWDMDMGAFLHVVFLVCVVSGAMGCDVSAGYRGINPQDAHQERAHGER